MSNVVTIKRKNLLFDYSNSQKTKGVPESLIFLGGAILWLVLPKFIYIDAGGPVPAGAFAILAFAGIIGGVTRYNYPPPGPSSIIGPGSQKQSPRISEPPQRKAA